MWFGETAALELTQVTHFSLWSVCAKVIGSDFVGAGGFGEDVHLRNKMKLNGNGKRDTKQNEKPSRG